MQNEGAGRYGQLLIRLFDYFDDLTDVELMCRLTAVEFADDLGCEVLGLHVLGEELAAEKCPAGLRIGHGFAAGDGSQTGLGILVAVPAGLGAHDVQSLLLFLGIEGDGEILVLLKITVGMAVGADVDRGHALAPQTAHAAPGDGHGVMIFRASGGDQRPVMVKLLVCIDQKLTHENSSFLH